jgi:hypothetical protein
MAKSPEAVLQKTRREALELFRLKARPTLEAVLGLVEHLESVEALDQAAVEAESRREAADRDLAERKEHNRKLREEAAGLLDQAKADAAAIVADARANVERMADEAKDAATAVRAAARVEAGNIVAAAERKRDDLLANAENAQDAVDAANAELASIAAQRDELNAQIEAARAVVGKLMGG